MTMIRDGVRRDLDGSIVVYLSIHEFAQAARAAADRMSESGKLGLNHASTYQRTNLLRLQEETIGACGELAWAKATGTQWHAPIGTFHEEEDAGKGSNIEIRSTSRDSGCLILRSNDPEDRAYILITGDGCVMTIRGGIMGVDGRQEDWVRNPNGHREAWFVPQEALSPIKDEALYT